MTFKQWYARHETATLKAMPWIKDHLAEAFAAGKKSGQKLGLKQGFKRGRNVAKEPSFCPNCLSAVLMPNGDCTICGSRGNKK